MLSLRNRFPSENECSRGLQLECRADHSTDKTAQVVMTCNLYGESSDEALKTQALHNDSQTMDLKEKVCRDTRQTIMISFNDIKRIQQKLAGLDQQCFHTPGRCERRRRCQADCRFEARGAAWRRP